MKNRGQSFYCQWQEGEKNIYKEKQEQIITREKVVMSWAGLLVGLANCQICRIKVLVLKHRHGKEKEKNSYLLIVIKFLVRCKL